LSSHSIINLSEYQYEVKLYISNFQSNDEITYPRTSDQNCNLSCVICSQNLMIKGLAFQSN